MHQFYRFSALALVGVLTGCASYRPAPLVPGEELAKLRAVNVEDFVIKRDNQSGALTPSDDRFDLADGLSEAEVVAIALALNSDLKAKRLEVGETEALLIGAKLWPNPVVGLGIRPGIDGASGYVLETDVLFELLRFGERDAREKASQAAVGAVRANIIADEFRLVGEVRSQLLQVYTAERVVAILQEAVDLRQRAFDLVQRQRELGEATTLAVAATELERTEAARELRQAKVELSTELRDLNRLMGLPPDYQPKLSELGQPLTVEMFEDVSDTNLDALILAGRPELRAKEAEYARVEQELRLAVLKQYPRLGIGPSFERELGGDKSLGLSLSLQLPLFYRNQGEITEKRATRDKARAEYGALLHRLRAEAYEARAAVRTAKAEVDAQDKEILPLLRRNQELFEGAYRAREINIIDWITAQQRAVIARREYLDAVVKYRQSLIELETASGRELPAVATTTPSTRSSH